MCYVRLENKTSRVETLLREIANTLLIREKDRTFESQKSAEKLVNIHTYIFFKPKTILNFLIDPSATEFLSFVN